MGGLSGMDLAVLFGSSVAAVALAGMAVIGEDFLARGRPWIGGRPKVTLPPAPGEQEVVLVRFPAAVRMVCRCEYREGDVFEFGLREAGGRQEVFCGRCDATLAEVQEV